MAVNPGERLGRIEERVGALERETGGARSEIALLRVDLVSRHEATRTHIDAGLQRVTDVVRQDLSDHMQREEADQGHIRAALARVERWRWSMMGALGLLTTALGFLAAVKWW